MVCRPWTIWFLLVGTHKHLGYHALLIFEPQCLYMPLRGAEVGMALPHSPLAKYHTMAQPIFGTWEFSELLSPRTSCPGQLGLLQMWNFSPWISRKTQSRLTRPVLSHSTPTWHRKLSSSKTLTCLELCDMLSRTEFWSIIKDIWLTTNDPVIASEIEYLAFPL